MPDIKKNGIKLFLNKYRNHTRNNNIKKRSTCVAGAGLENKSTIGSEETKNGLLTEDILPLTGLLTLA